MRLFCCSPPMREWKRGLLGAHSVKAYGQHRIPLSPLFSVDTQRARIESNCCYFCTRIHPHASSTQTKGERDMRRHTIHAVSYWSLGASHAFRIRVSAVCALKCVHVCACLSLRRRRDCADRNRRRTALQISSAHSSVSHSIRRSTFFSRLSSPSETPADRSENEHSGKIRGISISVITCSCLFGSFAFKIR